MGALSLALAQADIGVLALTPELATLEDLFFQLTDSSTHPETPSNVTATV